MVEPDEHNGDDFCPNCGGKGMVPGCFEDCCSGADCDPEDADYCCAPSRCDWCQPLPPLPKDPYLTPPKHPHPDSVRRSVERTEGKDDV